MTEVQKFVKSIGQDHNYLESMFGISPSVRVSVSPFHARINQQVKSFTVYNNTLLATVFRSIEEDYWHLCNHVQLWDVSCQKQLQLKGKDAHQLLQLTTPRNLINAQVGKCYYCPIVNQFGGIINDPVVLKIAEDEYWLSLADSDMLYFYQALLVNRPLDVQVNLLSVAPLAIQGPKSDELMNRLFGNSVKDIKFFNFKYFDFKGHSFLIARSGWSKQGGYEIYVDNLELALPLWDELIKLGEDLQVRLGCPNLIERIEGGLLSFGNDMNYLDTPMDCGLQKYCDLQGDFDFLGKEVLQKQIAEQTHKQFCGFIVHHCKPIKPITQRLNIQSNGQIVGNITSNCYSSKLAKNIALGFLNPHINKNQNFEICLEDGTYISCGVHKIPFVE